MRSSSLLAFGTAIAAVAVIAGCGGESNPTAVGNTVPDFKVVVPTDTTKTLSKADLKGKVALIDFWATWCGSCREEMPTLAKIWKANKDSGLEVIAVSQEKPSYVLEYESVSQYQLPFYIDTDGSMNKDFNIVGLPTTLVVGKDGKIVYSSMGFSSDDEQELQDAVKKALQG